MTRHGSVLFQVSSLDLDRKDIFQFSIFIPFLAELFRGMLFKWKGANKKSHQK